MVQGHAGIWGSDKRRRIASILVLVNVGLVVLAALWRHAAADEPSSVQTDAATESAGAPQFELPPATESLPAEPAPRSSDELANDPVMEELREVIRDPDSGLAIPRLDETSPLAAQAQAMQATDFNGQLQQRIETMHALSAAALALVREARGLSVAGQKAESTALMQHAAELRKMIAALAANAEVQP